MKYPKYEIVELPDISCGRYGESVFALSYRGNCEKCAWMPSGYCPCIKEMWNGEFVKHKGKKVPLVIVCPGEDSPEDCWKEEMK